MRIKLVHGIIILALVLLVVAPACTGGGAPDVLINELLPNSFGMDEDATGPRNGGHEALELVNLESQDVNISNWKIKNAQGDVLMTFTAGTVIPGKNLTSNQYYYLVVILGSEIPSLVDDFDDADTPYTETIFLGSNQGDLIDNNSDAVVLENANGEVIDVVLFGIEEPSGPEVDKVKDDNQWVGARVNTSFDGGIPLGDGEGILGRDRDSTDSNKASDWRVDGGADALGGTFGGENGPNRFFPDIRVLLHDIQGYVNEMVAFLSASNSVPGTPYLGIDNAYYDDVDIVASGDDYTVTAEHYFDYTISDTTPGTLSGTLTAVYSPTAGHSDSLEVDGILTDPVNGNSLNISIQDDASGFGTASHTLSLDIAVNWTEPSDSYSYHNIASWVETWAAQDRMTITDHRAYTDWSNPALKVSDATYDIQYVADGVTTTDFNLRRDWPYWAEPFGQPQLPSSNDEVAHFEFTTTINSDGEVARNFTRYDISLDDGINPITKYMELESGKQGSLTLTRTGGVVGDFVGTYDETLDLPLTVYDLGVPPSRNIHVTMDKELTQEFVTNPAGDEVFVARATIIIEIDDVEVQRFYYYVDGWRWWLSKVAKVVAVGACAVGGVATSPSVVGAAGFAAGSAVVYEIWDVVESEDK